MYDGLLMYEGCLQIHPFTSTVEKILLYQTFMHITHKKASNLEKEIPQGNTVDPIRFIALP